VGRGYYYQVASAEAEPASEPEGANKHVPSDSESHFNLKLLSSLPRQVLPFKFKWHHDV
jgi:hypothetical protein